MNQKESGAQWLLLIAVFVIATCGLIYELVAGTLASYLLGDSITQFSTIIGVYLFSMGIGSYLSRFFDKQLLSWFIRIELLVGVVGGFSAAVLFICFPLVNSFRIILYAFVVVTGVLVGLEIPLLMRILKDRIEFKDLVSRVFTFDYIGALLASLIFPLLLVPHLGLIRTALFFGILNVAIGWYLAHYFRKEIKQASGLQFSAVIIIIIQLVAFVLSDSLMNYSETLAYNDRLIYANASPYQRMVITKNKKEIRLFLNGNLQFSSADEYRYHEALVHPAMSSVDHPQQVLVLGGGDGLAVREVLKYPGIKKIVLVDLDPAMTTLFSKQEILLQLNNRSLLHPSLKIVNDDAFLWLRNNKEVFDVIIVDFPDPSNFSIGKLYSNSFYKLLKQSLSQKGVAVVQSTSPLVAPMSFWCIDTTIRSAGLYTRAYHNMVPSFGEWGYIMAMNEPNRNWFGQLPAHLRFLNRSTVSQMFVFPEDMKAPSPPSINKLNNQSLVHYFEDEWEKYLDM